MCYNAWRNDINILHYMHYTISGLPSSGACYAYAAPRGEGAVIATMDSGHSLRLPSTPHWPLACLCTGRGRGLFLQRHFEPKGLSLDRVL